MITEAFEYLRPTSITEALSMLQTHGEDAKILAGGQSLIPMMKLRLAAPKYLVDINGISELEYIREEDGFLRIGTLTREVAVEESELIKSKYGIIAETAKTIADPQIRNLATVGGNLAHGDPGNDHPATMIALKAQVVIAGPEGDRSVDINDFFEGFFETSLKPNEILKELKIPIPSGKSAGSYIKIKRKIGDFAAAGVAVQLSLDDSGTCRSIGIGLTNVDSVPLRAKRSEDLLLGKQITDELIKEASQLASDDSNPTEDLRGSEEYKKSILRVITGRALKSAVSRANGDM
ncbi:MAG: xanthine dehydrogenase family protein subunit M [Candidatus Heimdallarchaeota archaeon]|nr:xanthine dehydrogenase family protein subunit M [Candidatus Heimdallarchaeota archaeon]